MKERIKKHVDQLFTDIYDTRQLRELKEEICSNLLEKVNDYVSMGENQDEAFHKAVSNLGDMSELIQSLKQISEAKQKGEPMKPVPLDREHIIGYITASAFTLAGLLTGGILYLGNKDLILALIVLIPFFIVALPLYVYFGLTQETEVDYGMSKKRARLYSLAFEILLIGAGAAGSVYLNGQKLYLVLAAFAPFVIGSAVLFIYLGLTEKSRRKMDSQWEKQWVEYYKNPQMAMVRGMISGILWILAFTAFIVGGFSWSWKYSWISLILATVMEMVIEAIFVSKRKNNG